MASPDTIEPELSVAPSAFRDAFSRFQRLILPHDGGRPFAGFDQGVTAAEEDYKPRLRDYARGRMAMEQWTPTEVGTGAILGRVIDAVEIQDSRVNLNNNLVFWQNRYGPANRDHRGLLEAAEGGAQRHEIESLLYDLYLGGGDEGAIFDRLGELTGAKYPLLAYLYFLHDSDRFMPIQPTTYDRAFRRLGIGLVTLRNGSWDNYRRFNTALQSVRQALSRIEGLENTRLIDAHSFCWILETFEEPDSQRAKTPGPGRGRIVGGPEKSIVAMRMSILDTVQNSNGQPVMRTLKDKQTSLSAAELDAHLAYLIEFQGGRCALTGIPFDYHTADGDRAFRPSPDRIDSAGHYDPGNIQVVCQFVNFWKGAQEDAEFRRLLAKVRSET